MKGREEQVKAAIKKPHRGIIYRDVDVENRDIYYRRPRGKRYYIKEVVEFDNLNNGSVITAFRASARKKGEQQIWPK